MEVRRLTQPDGTLLEAALRGVLQPEKDLLGSASLPHLDRIVTNPNCYFFVCLVETQPIGFLSAYRFPGVEHDAFLVYLYDIAVRVECRRRGVTRIWVGTSVKNRAASRIFEATGAQRVSETYIEFIYDLGGGRT